MRWKAPELSGAEITDVSGEKITFKGKEGATRVPKHNTTSKRCATLLKTASALPVCGLEATVLLVRTPLQEKTAAAEKHAINTKGTGTSGRASADHAISTNGTGAAGRASGKASPTPAPAR